MPQYIGAFNDTVRGVGLRELTTHFLGLRTKVYQSVTSNTGSHSEVGLFGFRAEYHPGDKTGAGVDRAKDDIDLLLLRLKAMTVDKVEAITVNLDKWVQLKSGQYDIWFEVRLSVSPR